MAFFKYFPTTQYRIEKDTNINIVDIFRQVRAVSTLLDDVNAYEFYNVGDGERPDVTSFKLYDTVDYYWTFFLLNDNLREGLNAWPKSYSELEDFVNRKYPGYAIQGTRNAGATKDDTNVMIEQFTVGETITGETSGATATIGEIIPAVNQIVLTQYSGTFSDGETINGANGGSLIDDSDYNWAITLYADAVKYYANSDDEVVDFTDLVFTSASMTPVSYKEYETNINDNNSSIRVLRKDYVEDFANTYRELVNR